LKNWRQFLVSILVLGLSWLWFDRLWLFFLTAVLGLVTVWWLIGHRIIWSFQAVLIGVMLLFFVYRPGGASNYTNHILSAILALSLVGAVVELAIPVRLSDEK